ncbi:MAG TPA: imidazole glycerol phosphate synthase subunit HisF [Candidatus Caldiarchaeum subterraneum]|uniref:Imidazole glycerol phosphate synthase subunit HisF n=1 Tax=Caldiarchaeum subterraneum TaxID=311458 RepID=A0A832ZW02_CALS0|nr:imidazole glycerol phosphate synthase subunit HisF [Candidatus Caldarchaeum subterraneum]
MLAKRIIPCLDVDAGRVVKGTKFVNLRDAGDPAELASFYSDEGADELVFLDITASVQKRDILVKVVRDVASVINIPFTVGGGIKTKDDADTVLRNGADKISINTSAVQNPNLIKQLSEIYGAQCIVIAIDALRNNKLPSGYEVYTHSGKNPTGLDAVEWAKKVQQLGAGEILLTSIDQDGTRRGYDIELTRKVSEEVNIPVIASGGAGEPEHIYRVLTDGGADAALAASIFHYRRYTIMQVKEYLKQRGIEVRV